MNRLHLASAGIAILVGLSAASFYKQLTSPMREPKKRTYATCLGETSHYKFKLKPHFFLNKKFLKKDLSEADLHFYVDKHIRHIYTILPTFSANTNPKYSVIPYDGLQLSNIKSSAASYPLNMKVDGVDLHAKFLNVLEARQDLDSIYISEAMAAGQTSTSDEAIRVDYEAEANFITCEELGKFAHHLYLPADPFLGYWFVPPEKREARYNIDQKKDLNITPCATPEFLYDYDPYYYWFYWSLDNPTCKGALIPNSVNEYETLSVVKQSTETTEPFSLDFLKDVKGRPLRMTIAMTLIEDDSVLVKEQFDPGLKQRIDDILADRDFNSTKEKLKSLDRYDIALQTGLVFAWSLNQMSSEFVLEQVQLNQMLLEWRIKGIFRRSSQPYEVHIVIGSAMTGTPSFGDFYKVLNEGIAASDIVYFRGHSGAGKNLSKNRIDQQIQAIKASESNSQAPHHQLITLMSCYSLRYFPMDTFPVINHPFKRDIIYTASVPQDYDSKMLVGLAEQIDMQFAEGHHLPFERWPETFGRDVLLVHKSSSAK